MEREGSLTESLFAQMDWAADVLRISKDIIDKELRRFKFRELTADRVSSIVHAYAYTIIQVMEDSTRNVLEFAERYQTDLRGASWLKSIQTLSKEIYKKHGSFLNS